MTQFLETSKFTTELRRFRYIFPTSRTPPDPIPILGFFSIFLSVILSFRISPNPRIGPETNYRHLIRSPITIESRALIRLVNAITKICLTRL